MNDEERSLGRRLVLFMPILVMVAALYAAWMFYSRWNENVQRQRAAQEQAVERARQDVALNGGEELKITALYADAPSVAVGGKVDICYGVVNAKSVSFDPPIGEVWPSLSRCVEVHPKKTTTYTLRADDGAGRIQTEQLRVVVK
jgi:hypothetical protein